MLIDELKRRITVALKAGNTVEKEVLRVALGEIQIADARGTAVTDELVATVLRENARMLELATELGFRDAAVQPEFATRDIVLDLQRPARPA